MPSSTLTTEFLLGFLESYPAAVSVFDPDGRMVFVNDHGCGLLKKSKAELIGTHVQDFVADPDLFVELHRTNGGRHRGRHQCRCQYAFH